jgi:hypothetical protein
MLADVGDPDRFLEVSTRVLQPEETATTISQIDTAASAFAISTQGEPSERDE